LISSALFEYQIVIGPLAVVAWLFFRASRSACDKKGASSPRQMLCAGTLGCGHARQSSAALLLHLSLVSPACCLATTRVMSFGNARAMMFIHDIVPRLCPYWIQPQRL
jgi:hypothetical protein